MLQVVHPINLAIQYSKVVENEKKLDIRPREMLLRVQYGQILTVDREACVHGDQLSMLGFPFTTGPLSG